MGHPDEDAMQGFSVLAVEDEINLLVRMPQALEEKDPHARNIRSARIRELMRFPGRVFVHDKDEKK